MHAAGFLVLLAGAASVALAERPDLPAWSAETAKTWWTTHDKAADWLSEAERLRATLVEMQELVGTEWAMAHPDFRQWMRLAWWLSLFPADWKSAPGFRTPELRAAYAALGQDPALSSRFLASLRPEDDATAALRVLCELHRDEPTICRALPGLAVAVAVVWDQPVPDAWPHPFVQRRQLPMGRETPSARLRFFAEAHHNGKLLYDPRSLSVNDLTFVVACPLDFDEIRYGQSFKVRESEQLWDLYRAVKYDMDRIKAADPAWPLPEYRLDTIWKRGGICADQAYLASSVFQAKGIPVILFLGQGVGGDHAWVGYRKPDGEWNLNIARYRRHNYPVGQAVHPQTRLRITDTELASYTRNLHRRDAWLRSRIMLGWARLNPESPFYGELVLAARHLVPDSPETWEMQETWLREHGADPQRLRTLYLRWIEQFAKEPAMRFRGQKALYKLYLEHGHDKEAESLKEAIVKECKDTRFDLGIHLAAEGVFDAVQRGNWDRAEKAFEVTMRDFRGQAGGHLYYGLLEPYVHACLQDGETKRARDAMKETDRFQVRRSSILANDIRKLAERVRAAR